MTEKTKMDEKSAATKAFPLAFPITYQDTRYAELTLRRPKLKDKRFVLAKAESDPIGGLSDYIANLAGIPPKAVEELDDEDFRQIKEWLDSFTPGIGT